MALFFKLFIVLLTLLNTNGKKVENKKKVHYIGDIPDEEYGYIEVRPGAHMFYWFYGANNSNIPRNDLPIVLWLQGGPGAGGSGYGNFGEIGPLDVNLSPREYAWTNKVNLLFLDNPVGAGYSYVEDNSLFTKNVSQISSDLLICHQQLVIKYSFLSQLPYWIFSESYGGKMSANFGVKLYNAISNNEIVINFQGVMLGDSWISGIDYVNTWPLYLDAFTLIDNNELIQLQNTANQCQNAINNNNWTQSTNIWAQMETQIENYTNNADFYYVLQFDFTQQSIYKNKLNNTNYYIDILKHYHLDSIERYLTVKGGVNDTQISYIMNNQIKQELGIIPENVTWGGQSDAVFNAQNEDFMKPVVNDVDILLSSGVDVNIWNGQLDLICCTLGTLEWLKTINWKYKQQWNNSKKIGIKNAQKNDILYFKKGYLNLNMYYMMKSGHMVPADNPAAAQMAMSDITGIPY